MKKNTNLSDGTLISQKTSDTISAAFGQHVRPFIDIIDELRKCGLDQDIDLPNVVVVGDQSSGKSSIIEAISGIQLPRGNGIVTRCPLELQLKRVPKHPWNAVLRYKNSLDSYEERVIRYPHDVEENIHNAQDEICGSGKGVSNKLITLAIESSNEDAPDLTLIDLPGIARTALTGQPSNICDQIQDIIKSHICKKSTVILCVVSANVDAAVNESIKIAKEFDCDGKRTLGIITKPDAADDANKDNVISLLNNEKIPLLKGFHMVKCRSQKALDEKMSLEQSLYNEKIFFKEDPYYRDACIDQLGIPNLSKRITDELIYVIKENLPILRDEISTSLEKTEDLYFGLPIEIPQGTPNKLIYLTRILSDMNQELNFCLNRGKCNFNNENIFYRWRQFFAEMEIEFSKIRDDALQTTYNVNQLKSLIQINRKNEIVGFLNFELFEQLVKEHLTKYKEPSRKLINKMKKNTEQIIDMNIKHFFEHLPCIHLDLKKLAFPRLEEAVKMATEQINVIFEKERLIYSHDGAIEKEIRDFLSQGISNSNGSNVFSNFSTISNNNYYGIPEISGEKMSCFIKSYLKIVHSRLYDNIPMTIRYCLHVELGKVLKTVFFDYIKSSGVEEKIKENDTIHKTRENLLNKIKRLKFADEKLANF